MHRQRAVARGGVPVLQAYQAAVHGQHVIAAARQEQGVVTDAAGDVERPPVSAQQVGVLRQDSVRGKGRVRIAGGVFTVPALAVGQAHSGLRTGGGEGGRRIII